MGAITSVNKSVQGTVEAASLSVESSEAFQKVVKIAAKAIEITSAYSGVQVFVKVAKKLKSTDHFLDLLAFFTVSKGILYPETTDKEGNPLIGKERYIPCSSKPWQYKVEKISMFALKALVFSMDEKFGFVSKGFLARQVGSFVLFGLTIDFLILTNCTMGLWRNKGEYKDLKDKISKTDYKARKWETKKVVVTMAELSIKPKEQDLAFLKTHYEQKQGGIRGELAKMTAGTDQYNKEQKKLEIVDVRLNALRNNALNDTQEGLKTAFSTNSKGENSEKRIFNKCEIYMCRQSNNKAKKSNMWWEVATSVSKMSAVLLVIGLKLANFSAFITVLFVKMAVDTIGLGKIIYKTKTVKEPAKI
jgi:hypothetical protein